MENNDNTETVFLVFAEDTTSHVQVPMPDGRVQGTYLRMWTCVGVPPGDEVSSEMEAIAYVANAMSRKGRYLAVTGEAFTIGLGIVTPESIVQARKQKELQVAHDAQTERIRELERELGVGEFRDTKADDRNADLDKSPGDA